MFGTRIDPELLAGYKTQTGEAMDALLAGSPVLLVFLRHFG